MKNNVLIISCVFPPEPIVSAQLSRDIAFELAKESEVVVLSPKPSRPYNFKLEAGNKIDHSFKHVIVNSFTSPQLSLLGRMRESYSFGKACQKYIKKNKDKFDIVYLNAWPIFAQYFIVKTAKKYNIPCIVHVQDIYPESFTNKLKFGVRIVRKVFLPIDKYILQNAQKIICISENMRQHLNNTRRIELSKMTVVANWQNEDSFIEFAENNTKEKTTSELFTFMYLGNNGPVAGVDFLITSFAKANIKNSQLIIAGGGSKTDDCKQLADKLRITNRVYFITVPDGRVPETQAMADVMLLPVKKGGAMSSIPSKLPAYMFSAKPIIGSLDLESDTARAIKDADCGILVKPENESKLIEAMNEIVNWNNDILVQKGKNGFNYAIDNFSKKINLEKVINIILSVK